MAAVSPPLPARRVVVVVGMHRSGTSVTASILQAIGVDLGGALIQADDHNRAGYFEHERIVRLNERILDRLDRKWVGPKGTLPFPEGWWLRDDLQPIRGELTEIVRRELEKGDSLWGFKDPRVSRMIPLWREIFADLGVTPSYILSVRHPTAVSASLRTRDGLSPEAGQLLWLEHNLEAVVQAGPYLSRVVEYDRWLTAGEEQAVDLAAAIGIPWKAEAAGALAALIRPDLRHARPVQQSALPMADEVYRELAQASITGMIPAVIWRHEQGLHRAQALLRAWSQGLEGLPAEPSRAKSLPAARPAEHLRHRLRHLLGD